MSISGVPPPFDPNIPVITPGGGTTAAYKDPNSPESLMKKATLMNAQAAEDSRYDVKEGFSAINDYLGTILALFLVGFVAYSGQTYVKGKRANYVYFFIVALALFYLIRRLI
jgi:hypothetical protein